MGVAEVDVVRRRRLVDRVVRALRDEHLGIAERPLGHRDRHLDPCGGQVDRDGIVPARHRVLDSLVHGGEQSRGLARDHAVVMARAGHAHHDRSVGKAVEREPAVTIGRGVDLSGQDLAVAPDQSAARRAEPQASALRRSGQRGAANRLAARAQQAGEASRGVQGDRLDFDHRPIRAEGDDPGCREEAVGPHEDREGPGLRALEQVGAVAQRDPRLRDRMEWQVDRAHAGRPIRLRRARRASARVQQHHGHMARREGGLLRGRGNAHPRGMRAFEAQASHEVPLRLGGDPQAHGGGQVRGMGDPCHERVLPCLAHPAWVHAERDPRPPRPGPLDDIRARSWVLGRQPDLGLARDVVVPAEQVQHDPPPFLGVAGSKRGGRRLHGGRSLARSVGGPAASRGAAQCRICCVRTGPRCRGRRAGLRAIPRREEPKGEPDGQDEEEQHADHGPIVRGLRSGRGAVGAT